MKKVLYFVLICSLSVGCYDDSALWESVNDHEDRISQLEELCARMNTNISSLQTIVDALQKNDYVTSTAPIMEGRNEIGYIITFASGKTITVYHGKDGIDGEDGKDGVDGKDGNDGYSPMIGVRMDTDGVYYWTVDGEWIRDEYGNKIPAAGRDGKDGEDGKDGVDGEDGKDGADGKDGLDGEDGKDGVDGIKGVDGENGITPKLKIEEGYWFVSYDDGSEWEMLGEAVSEPDGCYLFKDVELAGDYVQFILWDNNVISVPLKCELSIAFVADVTPAMNYTMKVCYTVNGTSGQFEVAAICESGWISTVNPTGETTGEILLTAPMPYKDGKMVVLLNSSGQTVMTNIELAPLVDFKDESVGSVCVENFDQDGDGRLSLKEASEVTSESFAQMVLPESATSFDEFRYFTSVTEMHTTLYESNIVSVLLPESIRYISGNVFSACASLKSINIPQDVQEIGPSAFSGCSSLETIYIHSLEDWMDITISGNLFGNAVLPSLVDKDGRVLTDIVVPRTEREIKAESFAGIGIKSIKLHAGVNSIEAGAFDGCTKLETIHVEDLDHWMRIDNGGWIDAGCPALVDKNGVVMDDIVIPEGPERIDPNEFAGVGIKSVVIPSTVTYIADGAFAGCEKLKYIRIPSTVTEIGTRAFAGCTSVETVCVQSAEHWFDILFAGDDAGIFCNPLVASSMAGNSPRLVDYDGNVIDLSVIPDGTTIIGRAAYAGLAGLETLVIPSSVVTIEAGAFAGCTNLKTITIPESVRNIYANAFECCSSVQRVNISSVDHWLSIRFETAFSSPLTDSAINGNTPVLVLNGSDVRTSISVPEGMTGIPSGTFCGLTGMTELTIPSSVVSISDDAFVGCVNLEKLTVPASVELIGNLAFRQIPSLKELVLLGGIKDLSFGLFQNLTNLTDITLPSSVKSIPMLAFLNCTSLKNISLSEGLESISQLAFNGCNALEEITLPSTVSELTGAFINCESLSKIYVKNPVPPSSGWDIIFDNCALDCKIYVPRESLESYKSAFGWSSHAAVIEPYDF